MTASLFLLAGTDGKDIGYDKSIVDALMAVAKVGDRRGFSYNSVTYSGSWAFDGRSRVQNVRTWLTTDTVPTRTGVLFNVTTDGQMATALAAAVPGDWIVVALGTYTGTYTVSGKTGDALPGTNNVIVIISKDVYDSMPGGSGTATVLPPLVRVSDADKAHMPYFKNVSLANAEQWAFNGNTRGTRFIGIRFGADATVTGLSRLIRVGNGDGTQQTGPTVSPQNVGFDRCHFDGHATLNLKCAMELHGRALWVSECYFGDNIHHDGQDCQAIRCYNGPGPYRIVNNRLAASTEVLMFGGAYSMPGCVPQDLECRWNEITKSLTFNAAHPSYAGKNWDVKNLFEAKKLQWACVEGNWIHNTWPEDQAGAALLIKAESYGDRNTTYNGVANGDTHDVLVRWNLVESAGFGINIAGVPNAEPAVPVKNVYSVGNLYVIGAQYFDASQNPIIGMGLFDDIGTINDTFITKGPTLAIAQPGGGNSRLTMLNSIFGRTAYGIKGPSKQDGAATLAAYCPNNDIRKCVFAGCNPALYGAANFCPPDESGIGFANYLGGDYSLAQSGQVTPPPPPPPAPYAATFQQVVAPSASATSGVPLAVQPKFRVLDQNSAIFPLNGTIGVSVIAGQGSVLANATIPLVNGIASATNLTFLVPVDGNITMEFTPPAGSGLAAIDDVVTAVASAHLELVTAPGPGTSGAPLSPQPEVRLVDSGGNPLSLAGRVVTASPIDFHDGIVFSGATQATDANGHALFTVLAGAATATGQFSVRFSTPGAAPVDAPPVTVTVPAPPAGGGGGDSGGGGGGGSTGTSATKLVPTRLPEGAKKGQPLRIEPRFEWQDDAGHLVVAETAPVTLSVIGNAVPITGCTTTLPAIGGVVDFAGSGFGVDGRGHISIKATGTPTT